MKKVISLFLVFVMMLALCPAVFAVESLSDPIFFTWAWGANKIEVDNSLTVVSWSGGSNASYRSGFIVYDLPEGFTYESVKSEVIASFAINSATLNNGTNQAPTAAIVMVDGDKVKEAYNLKSGASATALLTDAKNNGVLLGTYKIGKYPRTSRIKNANINAFFEKHPHVSSIGFYVTNLAHDGYSGVVNGIASAMTDFEVNFTAYNNYANATVTMVDDKGNILDTLSVRDSVGSVIAVPETIEKNGEIWVRDTSDSYYLSETVGSIEVTYHSDKGDREKYVAVIENEVSALVAKPVTGKLNLPEEYVAEDGFVIEIEWYSDNESVVAPDGTVFQGKEELSTYIYAKVKIGEYTSVETEKIEVTIAPLDESETDENLVYSERFTNEAEKRGSFEGEKLTVDVSVAEEFTISAHVRIDDLSKGGTVFNIGSAVCKVDSYPFREGQWYHVAMTPSALYIDGENVSDTTTPSADEESFIGAYWGRMDNFYVYKKAFSQSVIKSLSEEEYDSPEIEIVSAYIIKGLDGALVRVASNGYEGDATVIVGSADDVQHSGYCTKAVADGVNIFSVSVPGMGGGLTEENATILLWDTVGTMTPLGKKHITERIYDFGFDYTHPDNHMLSNTFTLMDKSTNLYLTSNGVSQRADNGKWTGKVSDEGYYYLENENGATIDGNFAFEQVKGNTYKIKNADTGKYLSHGTNDEWTLNITEYNEVSKLFASEGFLLLDEIERAQLYSVSAQALNLSVARREKLCDIIAGGYFDLDGEAQAEKLREVFSYHPAYQINRAVNKSTTGVEAPYTLSDITWTSYTDMDGNPRSGYTATVVYDYDEEDLTVTIYARSQNVVRNIAKGFSYMPYQFIKPLKTVIDYNASNNQFKAEMELVYIETNYEVPADNVAITGAHELGHLVDFAGYRISMGDYKVARDNECSVSGYADTALNEDFAEFCQAVISCSGDKELLRQLSEMYPGRFDALCKGMCEMYGECYLK